ncbi:YggT family protein [Fusobacterium sp.]|uniref:YggT family protein n=1 Tax=Fusobacterium sp. TaxID=68766 RepID=UPI00261FBDEF|nr:YggT family protein [Fusobacterium sp.]
MESIIFKIINLVIEILKIVIVIRVVLSWVAPTTRNDFTEAVYSITEPMLKPFRMLLPLGYSRIDISPILAYFVLNLIRKLAIMLLF